MRTVRIQFNKYYSDGRYYPLTLTLSMTVQNSVRPGAELDDGRRVKSVDGDHTVLDDGQTMTSAAVLEAIIPNMEGMEVPGNVWSDGRKRTVAIGPDRDGRIMFDDGLETRLFGMSLGATNPFPGQRVNIDEHMDQFHEDRRLREVAGLIATP